MTTRRVSLKELAREIPDFAEATVAVQKKAVVRGLYRSLPMMAELSNAARPAPEGSMSLDTGAYAASWSVTENERSAIIGNYAPHAPVVEYGARPFTPPIAPLLAWAKRVLRDGSQPGSYSSNVWALAKYTQKKISEKGMQPHLVLTNALPDIIRNIEAEFKGLK